MYLLPLLHVVLNILSQPPHVEVCPIELVNSLVERQHYDLQESTLVLRKYLYVG